MYNTEGCSCNPRCSGKALSITYSECSFKYPTCKAHDMLSSVASPALEHLSTLSYKQQDSRKKRY